MSTVDRMRLRFYDQTGFSKMDLLPKRTRVRRAEGKGAAGPRKKAKKGRGATSAAKRNQGISSAAKRRSRTTGSNAHVHVSVFGITSIDATVPALYSKFYKSKNQNGQGTSEHVDFFLSAVEAGVLRDGDVVVLDNWSAHKSKIGSRLRTLLRERGIAMIYLPAKFSHLNSIEHVWRTAKCFARRAYLEFPTYGSEILMRSGCESLTHEEILSYMIHDGYEIDEGTANVVRASSAHIVRPSHYKKYKK